MITVEKKARIKTDKASESFSTAELVGVKIVDGYYVWPFSVPVFGADEVPDDYDADKRNAFKIVDGFKFEDFVAELEDAANTFGFETIVRGASRGVDLELRSKARPTAKAKLKDNDKMALLMTNFPDKARELIEAGTTSPQDFVKAFDALNAG